jgi:hypothetical protein
MSFRISLYPTVFRLYTSATSLDSGRIPLALLFQGSTSEVLVEYQWSTSGVQVEYGWSMSGVETPGVSPFPS